MPDNYSHLVPPAAGGLLLPPDEATALDRDAAGWPELALSAADLSAVELRLCLPHLDLGELLLPAPTGSSSSAPEARGPGERLALRDAEGVLIAVLDVEAMVDGHVSGRMTGVRLPAHPDAAALRRSPAVLAAAVSARGWRRVVGLLTDRPLFSADLQRLRDRLDAADGAVVAVLAGGVEATDPEHHTRLAALRAGLAELGPDAADRVLLTVVPLAASAGPDLRRAVAAGYGLPDADVAPAPQSPSAQAVRETLEGGAHGAVGPEPVLAALRRTHRRRSEQGLTILFTGLSGSGKSTVAGLLAVRLLELTARHVLLLDGDRVRRHLTAGLGFSRADRITNVRRIGWVAAQVSAAGGIAVCAPIAPYDSTRREVRAMVENSSPAAGFVLVHIATPLEECERRDRKGLYAKARSGELPEFTGISDPYEAPEDADVVADTTGREPAQVVDDVLDHLRGAGYLG